MAYQDIDRKRSGTIGGRTPVTSGSYVENEVPYLFSGDADSETKVAFPFQTEWFQISATSSAQLKYSFENGGTGNTKHMVVAANSSSPVIHARVDEIYVLENYSIMAKLSNIPSGSNLYSVDERA